MALVRFSILLIPILMMSCQSEDNSIIVRPVISQQTDSLNFPIISFDSYPYLFYGKKIKQETPIVDRTFTNRLRLNQPKHYAFQPEKSYPAPPLDVVMPDSVQFGNFFYYLLVLKSRKNALFSRLHTEEKTEGIYQIRAYHQEVDDISDPCSDYEENLVAFQPDKKGELTFQYFYYDSLYVERTIVVY